jgi:hypothetical protein
MEEAIANTLEMEEAIAITLENGGGHCKHLEIWKRLLAMRWKKEKAIAKGWKMEETIANKL